MFKFYTEGHVILCSISAFLDPPHDEKVWTPAFHKQLMGFFLTFSSSTYTNDGNTSAPYTPGIYSAAI